MLPRQLPTDPTASMTVKYSNLSEFSSDEAKLVALMQRDAAVLTARWLASDNNDDKRRTRYTRPPPSAETRARLAAVASRRIRTPHTAATREKLRARALAREAAKRNLKSQSVTVPPMTNHRRANHG